MKRKINIFGIKLLLLISKNILFVLDFIFKNDRKYNFILFSFSYPPQGMTEKEFNDLKISWLIKNERVELIESFLKQKEFQKK